MEQAIKKSIEQYKAAYETLSPAIEAGIEKYRKGNFTLKFDNNINNIKVRQTKHKFLFGCTAFMLNSFEAPEKEDKFKS